MENTGATLRVLLFRLRRETTVDVLPGTFDRLAAYHCSQKFFLNLIGLCCIKFAFPCPFFRKLGRKVERVRDPMASYFHTAGCRISHFSELLLLSV